MKSIPKYFILSCVGLLTTGFFILNAQDQYKLKDLEKTVNPTIEWTQDQLEVMATVDRFLAAAGNYDYEAIAKMTTENANVGKVRYRDGKWSTGTIMVSEFLEIMKTGDKEPYYEPVGKYSIQVSDGHLAIVKADAVLHHFGIPLTRNLDNFTLLKEENVWKFVNLSYSSTRIPENEKKFDINAFARGYNQAWCSQNPDFVAQFFAEDGSLMINDGEPAVGRKAITEVVSSFMTGFPDLMLTCDAVNITNKGTEFHWTFSGTNSGPGGTGKKVKFSGVELWQISDDGRIKTSDGHFDAAEYQDQVENGIRE